MQYSDSLLREFLPRHEPPKECIPPEVADQIARLRDEKATAQDPALLEHSTRWTYAIFNELARGDVRGLRLWWPPDYWPHIAVGLFDPVSEKAGFGLVYHVIGPDGPDFDIIATLEFPRLKAAFPLGRSHIRVELHQPPHPANATATAWARHNTSRIWGFITAGHAVAPRRPGMPVPLANGGTGQLLGHYHPPIDAAFVQSNPPGGHYQHLPMLSYPAAGQPVTVECQSGTQQRTIFRVMDALGVINTRYLGIYMFLDLPCQIGDSGALVITPAGEAVGIYCGSMPNTQTPTGIAGIAQHFEQATLALDIMAYR